MPERRRWLPCSLLRWGSGHAGLQAALRPPRVSRTRPPIAQVDRARSLTLRSVSPTAAPQGRPSGDTSRSLTAAAPLAYSQAGRRSAPCREPVRSGRRMMSGRPSSGQPSSDQTSPAYLMSQSRLAAGPMRSLSPATSPGPARRHARLRIAGFESDWRRTLAPPPSLPGSAASAPICPPAPVWTYRCLSLHKPSTTASCARLSEL